MDLRDTLRDLEEQLLTPAIRVDATALDRLIADEFIEFGSSGQVYEKQDVIAAALAHPHVTSTLAEFQVLPVTPDVALATYRTAQSVRTSLWRREANGWRIVFHQGTPVP